MSVLTYLLTYWLREYTFMGVETEKSKYLLVYTRNLQHCVPSSETRVLEPQYNNTPCLKKHPLILLAIS